MIEVIQIGRLQRIFFITLIKLSILRLSCTGFCSFWCTMLGELINGIVNNGPAYWSNLHIDENQ